MENLSNLISNYKKNNNLNDEQCSVKLGISVELLNDIESGNAKLNEAEEKRIRDVVAKKGYFKTFTFRKVLELLFRFGAAIMALVVLLLCINGIAETETLIVLLSIGVVCASITNLPKIDK